MMNKQNRKLDKRRLNPILEKLRKIAGEKGDSMYVKPFAADLEFIKEISRENNESNSTNAARLIHLGICALETERRQKNAQQGTLEHIYKLAEFNLKASEQNTKSAADVQLVLARFENRLILLEQNSAVITKLAAEIYCMANMAVSYINILFGKILLMISPDTSERNSGFKIASGQMIELGEISLQDVRSFFKHHNEFEAETTVEDSYLAAKIDRLKSRTNADVQS